MFPAQLAVTQAPPVQVCPAAQVTPHAPQLDVDVSALSQPSPGLPLQSAKPASQTMPQADPAQRPVAFGAPRHAESVLLMPSLLQRRNVVDVRHVIAPGVHVIVDAHTPPEHAVPAPQAAPAYPSPSALHTWRTADDAHDACPGVHTHGAHAPARQVVRAPHAAAV
jgi:hypothetical protein